MGVLVLIVGALLLVAGGYEMIAGGADILSERGWSAFIAGSVLVSGGVVTMALGVAVRAVDGLGAALQGRAVQGQAVQGLAVQGRPAQDRSVQGRPLQGRLLQSWPFGRKNDPDRTEPDTRLAASVPAAPAIAQPDPLHEPPFEHSATFDQSAAFDQLSPFDHAPTSPVAAAAPIGHDYADEAAPEDVAASAPQHGEPKREPQHDDWLDRSFADLEREMATAPNHAAAAAPEHPEPPSDAEPSPRFEPDPLDDERHLASAAHEEHAAETHAQVTHAQTTHAHEADATREAEYELEPEGSDGDHATVSAREEPAPPTSAVIGRYESEGTSYVMYADGSIDAQSAAGVYRFASMAELKTFIES